MPNALGHSIIGAVAAVVIVSLLSASIETKIIAGLCAFAFAFLPDIDHPKALARKVYRKVAFAAGFALFFIMLQQFAAFPLLHSIIFSAFLSFALVKGSEMLIPRHRGVMHKIWFGVIAAAAFYIALAYGGINNALIYAASGLVGYASHIVLDSI